jgi:L-fuculose-phosphate aldolase
MTNVDPKVLQETREELVSVAKELFDRWLSSGTSGNISARVPGYPDKALIKATGTCFGELRPEDFVLVDINTDDLVEPGDKRPSKEVHFHCGIYRERPEVGGIVHGHAPYATAVAAKLGQLPIVTLACQAGIGKTATVSVAKAGSDNLAEMVIAAFKEDKTLNTAILLTHGFVTVAATTRKAFYLADVLEDNAKTAYLMETLK